MSRSEESCRIDYDDIEAATPEAVLLRLDEEEGVWIPRSQILDESDDDFDVNSGSGWVEIPEWLAMEKGLI